MSTGPTHPGVPPPPPPGFHRAQPYDWVSIFIAVLLVLAVASVIGGFIESGNHERVVSVQGQFDVRPHAEKQNDWNYAYAGIAAAFVWCTWAVVLILLRGVARDARRLADNAKALA